MSMRRRSKTRPRSKEQPEPVLTGGPVRPAEWPSPAALIDGLNLAELLNRLVDQVSPDAVLNHLQSMTVRQRQHVLRQIGLTSASSVNRGMAAQLLARMRMDGPGDRSGVLHALVYPILNTFDLPLTAGDWNRIVNGEIGPLVRAYIDHPLEAKAMHFPSVLLPETLQPLGLLACVVDQVPADAVALAFLSNADEQAAQHMAALRETWPTLPKVHRDFTVERLSLVKRLADSRLGEQDKPNKIDELDALVEWLGDMSEPELDRWIARLDDPDLPEDPDPDANEQTAQGATASTTAAGPGEIAAARIAASAVGNATGTENGGDQDVLEAEALLGKIDDFNQTGWDVCLDLARAITAELEQGQLPDPIYVSDLLDQVREGVRLVEGARRVLSGPVPASRAALIAAESGLRERLMAADTTWLHQLAQLVAPEAVKQDAVRVRSLAQGLLDHGTSDTSAETGTGRGSHEDRAGLAVLNGLRALHTLILLTTGDRSSGAQPDYTAVAAAADEVRAALPHLSALLYAASGGAVTLPPVEQVRTAKAVRSLAVAAPSATAGPGTASKAVPVQVDHSASGPEQVTTQRSSESAADPDAPVGSEGDSTPKTMTPAASAASGAVDEKQEGPEDGQGEDNVTTTAAGVSAPAAPRTGGEATPPTSDADRDEAIDDADKAGIGGGPRRAVPEVTELEEDDPTPGIAQTRRDEDDDLSGLDALLAGGTAERLSALTGARRPAPVLPRAGRSMPDDPAATPPGDMQASRIASNGTDDLEVGLEEEVAAEARAEAVATVLPALLEAERYGLAADLLEASGAAPVKVTARRLAALATSLRLPTGPLASAFAEGATLLSREALSDDRAGQLLAWASACRIAVLAPSAGPATLLLELAQCVVGSPALTDFGLAMIDASRQGIVVVPEAAGALGTIAAIEQSSADLASEAGRLMRAALTKMFMYVPANGVYQEWMHPTGPIGAILSLVEVDDPATAADVSAMILGQRGRAERSMDEAFARQRSGQKQHTKITGTPRQVLISRWEDALDVASRWVEQVDRLADAHTRMQGVSWQATLLARLRQKLDQVREQVLADLDARRTDDPELDAALEAVASLLDDTVGICTSGAPQGAEPDLAYALHHELLATDLPLSGRSLLPESGLSEGHLGALVGLALGPASEPAEVYDIRAARGDHDLTAVLVAGLASDEPELAQVLERRRAKDVAERAAETAEQVAALASKIDTQRMASTLTDQAWSALSARAQALDEPGRSDFGHIAAEVAAIEDELGQQRAVAVAETVKRVRARASDNAVVAENAGELVALAERGEVASAEEYLEQALTGGKLPLSTRETDHLRHFFPDVPNLLGTHPDLLAQLRAALSAEVAPATSALPSAVQALGRAAGADLGRLSEARRKAGARALGSWDSLRNNSSQSRKLDLKSALGGVLSQAGLEFAEYKIEPGGPTGRTWLELRGVRGTGDASTPAFGSGMSPDGSTLRVLLVRNAPTPATVVEWMRVEPADRTVLVLWNAAPLSADDRRAIADAARGRPRPPVLLLDAAALAYLVCQAEPRRATFEATALPFTADSPFRDTAGDTAPEMFYGRIDELDAVLDLNGPSVVYGGRQLGKSALLRAARRRFEQDAAQRRTVLLSIQTVGGDGRPERLWDALWPRLAAAGVVPADALDGDLAQVTHDAILAWLNEDTSRQLLVLLDEADAFLEADAAGTAGSQFTHVHHWREIMLNSNRRAKVVFAGLHRTARFESLPNQPLSHLGRPVSVGPLKPQHAYDLLTKPMQALGFRFAEPFAGPARVLALTNNLPALLQLFGRALVAHLTGRPLPPDGPPTLVSREDIDAVFADVDLREEFRGKYYLTLNLDHRYMVITYAVAQAAHEHGLDASLAVAELSEVCRQAWPEGFASSGPDDFRALVSECVDLGVLSSDGGRYRVRTPTVLRLLGTEEDVLETLYSAPERLQVPRVSDGASYRRAVGSVRSPLTERQLGDLLTPARRVVVVAGCEATNLGSTVTAIERAHRDGAQRLKNLVRCHTPSALGVRRDVEKCASSSLLLVDATKLSFGALSELLQGADEAVQASPFPLTVAVVVGPSNASAWVSWPHRMTLYRVDPPGLRLWCDEDELPFRDEESLSALLERSGGWPIVLGRAASASHVAVPTAARVLEDLGGWLDGPGAIALASMAAVGNDDVLGRTFRWAADLTASQGERAEDLPAYLDIDDEADLLNRCRSSEYGSVAEIIDALLALGCLQTGVDGLVSAEPVLAAAVNRSRAQVTTT